LLHRHGNISVCGEPDFIAFDAGNKTFVDEMMMALVGALTAVLLRQLDPTAFDFVDCTNVYPVGTDDFHVLFDIHLLFLSAGLRLHWFLDAEFFANRGGGIADLIDGFLKLFTRHTEGMSPVFDLIVLVHVDF
jgi:hypothetical protein